MWTSCSCIRLLIHGITATIPMIMRWLLQIWSWNHRVICITQHIEWNCYYVHFHLSSDQDRGTNFIQAVLNILCSVHVNWQGPQVTIQPDGFVYFPLFPSRHILASLHFNENVQREAQTGKNGENYYRVSYPKFKLGEEVVRDVASPPTYGKYLGIFY